MLIFSGLKSRAPTDMHPANCRFDKQIRPAGAAHLISVPGLEIVGGEISFFARFCDFLAFSPGETGQSEASSAVQAPFHLRFPAENGRKQNPFSRFCLISDFSTALFLR